MMTQQHQQIEKTLQLSTSCDESMPSEPGASADGWTKVDLAQPRQPTDLTAWLEQLYCLRSSWVKRPAELSPFQLEQLQLNLISGDGQWWQIKLIPTSCGYEATFTEPISWYHWHRRRNKLSVNFCVTSTGDTEIKITHLPLQPEE